MPAASRRASDPSETLASDAGDHVNLWKRLEHRRMLRVPQIPANAGVRSKQSVLFLNAVSWSRSEF
jgi:hypothetical protein